MCSIFTVFVLARMNGDRIGHTEERCEESGALGEREPEVYVVDKTGFISGCGRWTVFMFASIAIDLCT